MPAHGSFKSLEIRNLLTFGSEGVHLELQPLSILIGPNAAGKSNLIQSLRLLQAAPNNLTAPIRVDGISEWLWKGANAAPVAEIQLDLNHPHGKDAFLRYRLEFGESNGQFTLVNEQATIIHDSAILNELYLYQEGTIARVPEGTTGTLLEGHRVAHSVQPGSLKRNQSILSQRREPDLYPELAYLAELFASIRIYADWNLGQSAAARQPQSPDTEGGFLAEDAGNLAIVLSELRNDGKIWDQLIGYLRNVHDRVVDVHTGLTGGKLQVYLRERDLRTAIPATRISDGTLRFLCLLAVLCHPSPPPLVALEEPELGLHPDLIPVVAELLRGASERTQLIVTTHSDLLVSQFTETPDAIVVCDRGPDGTYFRRLSALAGEEEELLGDQWLKGQLGGTRW